MRYKINTFVLDRDYGNHDGAQLQADLLDVMSVTELVEYLPDPFTEDWRWVLTHQIKHRKMTMTAAAEEHQLYKWWAYRGVYLDLPTDSPEHFLRQAKAHGFICAWSRIREGTA